jgi:hypothetical protein
VVERRQARGQQAVLQGLGHLADPGLALGALDATSGDRGDLDEDREVLRGEVALVLVGQLDQPKVLAVAADQRRGEPPVHRQVPPVLVALPPPRRVRLELLAGHPQRQVVPAHERGEPGAVRRVVVAADRVRRRQRQRGRRLPAARVDGHARDRPVRADQLARLVGHRLQDLVERRRGRQHGRDLGEPAQHPRMLVRAPGRELAGPGHLEVDAHPGDELAGRERLHEVVVGPGVETLDRGLFAGAGGQHDDRDARGRRVLAQCLEQPEAVEARHHHVGQHEVRHVAPRRGQRGEPVAHGFDLPVGAEQPGDVPAHVRVVVRDKDPAGVRVRARCVVGLRAVRQPARGLGDVQLGGVGTAAGAADAVRRQMLGPQRDRHRERRALPDRRRHVDRALVQLDELADEREPDAGALVRARPRGRDAVEAVEDARHLVVRDPGAGVADLEHRAIVVLAQADRDLPGERELQRVRDKVEDDLLPRGPVDVHRVDRRAVHEVAQPGLLDARPERARDLLGQPAEVGGLVPGLEPPLLDAREVEQRVHEPQQPRAVAARVHQALALPGAGGVLAVAERVLDRPEQQRQRRAEFVADVAEERGPRPVELGQRLRAPLGLVHLRLRDRGRDLARDVPAELAVPGVEQPARAEPGDEQASRGRLAGLLHRQDQRPAGRAPVRGQRVQLHGQVVDQHRQS